MKRLMWLALALLLAGGALFATRYSGGADREIVLQWPSIWVGQDSKAAAVRALVDQFNADNAGKIQVVIEPNPDYDGYRKKINTMMAAGQVPDMFVFNPDPTQFTYYEGDLLMDFTGRPQGCLGQGFRRRHHRGFDPVRARQVHTLRAGTDSDLVQHGAVARRPASAPFPRASTSSGRPATSSRRIGVTPTSQMTGGHQRLDLDALVLPHHGQHRRPGGVVQAFVRPGLRPGSRDPAAPVLRRQHHQGCDGGDRGGFQRALPGPGHGHVHQRSLVYRPDPQRRPGGARRHRGGPGTGCQGRQATARRSASCCPTWPRPTRTTRLAGRRWSSS